MHGPFEAGRQEVQGGKAILRQGNNVDELLLFKGLENNSDTEKEFIVLTKNDKVIKVGLVKQAINRLTQTADPNPNLSHIFKMIFDNNITL